MRILVVEDEKRLARALKRGLEEDGFAVDVAFDGADGARRVLHSDHGGAYELGMRERDHGVEIAPFPDG